jgi:hypothetical protein
MTYCSVLRFWDKEVDYYRLNTTPPTEDDVCVPTDLIHRNWPRELVE